MKKEINKGYVASSYLEIFNIFVFLFNQNYTTFNIHTKYLIIIPFNGLSSTKQRHIVSSMMWLNVCTQTVTHVFTFFHGSLDTQKEL